MERTTIRGEPRLKQQLEAEARKEGVRPSDIVRRALEEHLQKRTPRESAYDRAKRAGLIGVFKGGPFDLSINPEHMEGFGS